MPESAGHANQPPVAFVLHPPASCREFRRCAREDECAGGAGLRWPRWACCSGSAATGFEKTARSTSRQRQPGGVPARRGRDFYRRSPHRHCAASSMRTARSSPSAAHSGRPMKAAIFTTARDAPPTGSEAALEKKVGRPPSVPQAIQVRVPPAIRVAASRQLLPSIGTTRPRDVSSCRCRWFTPAGKSSGRPTARSKSPSRFSTHAGHAGYVAGNWAVRQSPKGEKILFVDHEAPQGHAVWSFDIKSAKNIARVSAGRNGAGFVLADFTPDGSRIACTAGRDMGGLTVSVGPHREMDFDADGLPSPHELDGIWIQAADGASWRHVAQSFVRADPQPSRGSARCWSDGPFSRKTARGSPSPGGSTIWPARHVALPCSNVGPQGRAIFAVDGQILDPHWSPDRGSVSWQ